MTKRTLVFAVCHPDDEALWVGGLLHGLSRIQGVRCLVVCLSGRDPGSPRAAEFEAARLVAGYENGVVLGGPLRSAEQPLPPVGATLEEGLAALGVGSGIDLLVTHPPHGDEHGNPHHLQAHRELRRWCRGAGVPFAFFSTVPLQRTRHIPELGHIRRSGPLHLTMLARCRGLGAPHTYAQFGIDTDNKRRQLECYRSIDLPAHERGYASFTSPVEGVYLADGVATSAFAPVLRALDPVGPEDQFAGLRLRTRTRAAAARAVYGRRAS